MITGYVYFAPCTFVINGLEGFLVGSIRDGRSRRRDLLGWYVGALAMVSVYFVAEAYMMGF